MSTKTEDDKNLTLEPFHCELNILSQSDGSAMLCEGKTSFIVSVNGPVDVKLQKLQIEKSTVEIIYRPKFGVPSVDDRFLEMFLRNICEAALHSNLYPRTAITVVVQEMHDNGGKLACATNACCLALINSGLSMRFLVAAVTCILDKKQQFSLISSSHQLQQQFYDEYPMATFTFVFENINYNIVASHTTGTFTDEQYTEAVHRCKLASEKIFEFYRNIVCKYAKKIGKRMDVQ
ncbi:exosome complex component RRP46 [Chrysoperla carnea]|uniref:exosome complex component RRP46 n=1 Tax=Chrysoperla carnea TaxID=189513 RepID=UPI001D07048F|nr:exosome complex component RRP46 [Chrysoperla carnea]